MTFYGIQQSYKVEKQVNPYEQIKLKIIMLSKKSIDVCFMPPIARHLQLVTF